MLGAVNRLSSCLLAAKPRKLGSKVLKVLGTQCLSQLDAFPPLLGIIEKKDAIIEKKDAIIEEKDAIIEKKDHEIKKYYEEVHQLQLQNLTLKNELSIKNTDYLRITKALHVRSVCEEFEANNSILGDRSNKDSRKKKWENMLKSNDVKSLIFKNCLLKRNVDLEKVPQIAKGLFAKINEAVHKDFGTSNDTLRLVKNYFSSDEFNLVLCIIECYGITSVEIVDINNE